jgi:type IV pilus assembly protein PilA
MKKFTLKSHKAFTMVELIFVIVIIGVLASVALPKFRGLSSNAKISAEIATMSSVAIALQTINGEWSINEGTFKWGIGENNNTDATIFNNTTGYPIDLHVNKTFDRVIKENSNKYTKQTNGSSTEFSIFTGSASNPNDGASSSDEKANKPDKNDFWIYAHSVSTDGCTLNIGTYTNKIYPGDFILIDVMTGTTNYSNITCP